MRYLWALAICLLSSSAGAQSFEDLRRQNTDCRLTGVWQSDETGDYLTLSGQDRRSGGAFHLETQDYEVSGGYRFDGERIHFQGTDNKGRNREWAQRLMLSDLANPSSFFFAEQNFRRIRLFDCYTKNLPPSHPRPFR
jgi:hypothetical protein